MINMGSLTNQEFKDEILDSTHYMKKKITELEHGRHSYFSKRRTFNKKNRSKIDPKKQKKGVKNCRGAEQNAEDLEAA